MMPESARGLVLVRHGAYAGDPRTGELTALGRRQAAAVARRLAKSEPFVRLLSSPAPRARQTAELIGARLRAPVETLPALREVQPSRMQGWRIPLETRRRGARQLASLRARLPAVVDVGARALLVCHGNLIRALVTAYLGLGKTAWTNLRIAHASITELWLDGDATYLVRFNDTGHLVARMTTWM